MSQMPRRQAALTAEERERLNPIRGMATELICQHLGDQDTDWYFAWNDDRRRIGICKFHAELQVGRIELSRHYALMNSIESVRATLLHEIAHGLQPGQGHNDIFTAACLAIGGDPSPCDAAAVMPPPKNWRYWAVCHFCHKVFYRRAAPKPGCTYRCVSCPADLSALEWVHSLAPSPS